MLPSTVVAVIVVVPALTMITFPVLSTVAVELSEDVHVTALFVAFVGATVAFKLSVPPTAKLSVVLFILTDVG